MLAYISQTCSTLKRVEPQATRPITRSGMASQVACSTLKRVEPQATLPLDYMSTHASDGTRTHTGQFLRLVPLPLGYTGRMLAERLELSALRSWGVCLYRLGYASNSSPGWS